MNLHLITLIAGLLLAILGFFIKGQNKSNPVLLYLHGGMPDYFLPEQYPTGLDEIFTVVWLEQRGAGLSYGSLWWNLSWD